MNKLPIVKRAHILTLLCEGMSMRAIARATGVSFNTIDKLLQDAGEACVAFHDKTVRGLKSQRVQCDEVWSFCYAKAKNVPTAKAAPSQAGDVWTWTALDADSKLIVSWMVGGRDADYALALMDDLRSRVDTRMQLTTDGHTPYLRAVEEAFGADIDYSMLIKLYGAPPASVEAARRYSPADCVGTRRDKITGNPDPKHVSTSYVERHNLSIRMGVRRFTRLTNAFSKRIDNHCHALAIYFVYYNFCRSHASLKKLTPAMAAGVAIGPWEMSDVVALIDAREEAPKARGPYKPRAPKLAISN
jgi:IS1 family transposase